MRTLLNHLMEKLLVESAQIVYVLTIVVGLLASGYVCFEKLNETQNISFQSGYNNVHSNLHMPVGSVQIVMN